MISEQNYRRWITKSLVHYLDIKRSTTDARKTFIDAIISKNNTGDEYLTISILRPMPELNNNANSVSIGFVLTDAVKKKIAFLNDTSLRMEKIGVVSEFQFETPFAMRKMRDEEARQADYEKLAWKEKHRN